MLSPVEVAWKKDPGPRTPASSESDFALTPSRMETLEDSFREEIERALTADGGYQPVDEPGPNVLRLDQVRGGEPLGRRRLTAPATVRSGG